MTGDTHIHLVRHGHVHNPQRILYGRLPRFRLSRKGVEQARETARYFEGKAIAAVYSSPMLRARQTARELLCGTQLGTLRISRLINEVLTPFEGRPSREVDALGARMYANPAPGFETPQDIVSRATRFLKRITANYRGQQVVAVTHGDVILFTLLWALEKPLDAAYKGRMGSLGMRHGYPGHCSVTTLQCGAGPATAKPSVSHWEGGPAT